MRNITKTTNKNVHPNSIRGQMIRQEGIAISTQASTELSDEKRLLSTKTKTNRNIHKIKG
jgi:hypothetical protein